MPCSKCKQKGHNRATCRNEPDAPHAPLASPLPLPVSTVDPLLHQEEKPVILPEEDNLKLRELVSICKEVAKNLGKGYPESVYQHALCKELQMRGIRCGYEVPMSIMYKGEAIPYNTQRLDIILYEYLPFIFELKATAGNIKDDERWQLVRYMDTQKKSYGAVVNFSQTLSGPIDISIIIKHEEQYKVYDIISGKVSPMVDYGYTEVL
jgi:GxxExxY protein